MVEKVNKKLYYKGLWLNFKRLARRLGIKDINIHTFHHSFASSLVMNGVDVVTEKEVLGQSYITTSMRCAHLIPGHKIRTVNRICSLSNGTILAKEEKSVL